MAVTSWLLNMPVEQRAVTDANIMCGFSQYLHTWRKKLKWPFPLDEAAINVRQCLKAEPHLVCTGKTGFSGGVASAMRSPPFSLSDPRIQIYLVALWTQRLFQISYPRSKSTVSMKTNYPVGLSILLFFCILACPRKERRNSFVLF